MSLQLRLQVGFLRGEIDLAGHSASNFSFFGSFRAHLVGDVVCLNHDISPDECGIDVVAASNRVASPILVGASGSPQTTWYLGSVSRAMRMC